MSTTAVARPTKAVIVAAGMGRRLNPYTDEMPKCLVPVGGRPMMVRQLEAFRAHGVDEVVVVRGYKADVLERRKGELGPNVRFVENTDYERNNILQSLFKARDELGGPYVFTYADIVFTHDVVRRLMDSPGDVCLVIDRKFRDIYDGRTDHPLSEGEVSSLKPDGTVALVGKRALPPEGAYGEFIGLAKFSAVGAKAMLDAWDQLNAKYAGKDDQPFQRAAKWKQAYLTDLLQHLIDGGFPMTPVPIDGEWREIDTVQDLTRAEKTVNW